MKPLVSIFLPTFRRRLGGFLEQSIESVLNQTYKEFELIVADDGSTDGSADLIAWYARSDSRVKHIRFERNIGLPALTLGLCSNKANGSLYAFVFDDCTLMPYHLERLTEAFDANPAAAMVYGQAEAHWKNGRSTIIGQPYSAFDMRVGNNHIPNVSVMLRRSTVAQFGWYDPHVILKRFCDWDLWLRIGTERQPVFVNEVLAHENGTKLTDSLGEQVTVHTDLMLRYSRTDRNDSLLPQRLPSYDPLRTDVLHNMSEEDISNINYLILEHLLAIKDDDAILARFGRGSSEDQGTIAEIERRYLKRRLQIVSEERNGMQQTLLALRPAAQAKVAELEATLAADRGTAESTIREIQTRYVEERASTERLTRMHAEESGRTVEALRRYDDLERVAQRMEMEWGDELSAAHAEIARLTESLGYLRRSKSWLLTAPLRRTGILIRRVARVAGRVISHRDPAGLTRGDLVDATMTASALPRDSVVPDESQPSLREHANDEPTSHMLRMVLIGDGPVTSIELLRLPLDYAQSHLGISFQIFYENNLPDRNFWSACDLIVTMRARTPATLSLIKEARELGTAVIFMTDDNLEILAGLEPADPTLKIISSNLRAANSKEMISAIAATSDLGMLFSKQLAAHFSKFFTAHFCPAVSGLEYYDKLLSRERSGEEESQLRIGYAGSPTHGGDVSIVSEVLAMLLEKYPKKVFVETIGQPIDRLIGHSRYRHFAPVSDLESYCSLQNERSWDIALAPLSVNPFNEAKSDNKYRTYGAAGVAGVYSRIASFEDSVIDGETGILVQNEPAAWFGAIERLILDEKLRQRIAVAARADVRERFGVETVAHFYRRCFSEATRGLRVLVVGFLALPTISIDIRMPFWELRRSGVLRYRMRNLWEVVDSDLSWAQVVVVVRAGEAEAVDVVRRAKRTGAKVIFSWDDDLLKVPPSVGELYEHYNRADVRASFQEMLGLVDLVKASTPRIAETSGKYAREVMVAPYGFDFSLLPKSLAPRQDGRVRVGYFGSVGRGAVFDCVVEALGMICRQREHVDVEFFGFCPTGMGEIPRVKFLPFLNEYEASIHALAHRQWDIGLAPLAMTDLSRAKLPTKYRDYAATGAAGIYTNIECYTAVIQHGYNGLLADNTVAGWHDAIAELVSDGKARKQMADVAYRDVSANFGLDCAVEGWSEAFRRLGFPIPR
jgi:glycosyltransferase involved in cell wall biosynthesis